MFNSNSNSCMICGYSITDPVCGSCYTKQTLVLLSDLKLNSTTNIFIEKKLKNIFYSEKLNDINCILCKKNNVFICHYCFLENLGRILEELNFNEGMINNLRGDLSYEENSLENKPLLDQIIKINKRRIKMQLKYFEEEKDFEPLVDGPYNEDEDEETYHLTNFNAYDD